VEAKSDYIVCTFLDIQDGEKSCSLVYGHDCQHLDSERLIGQAQEGNSVIVPLLQNTQLYCYHVTAISGGILALTSQDTLVLVWNTFKLSLSVEIIC
jgi:hypothetical protein